MASLLNDSKVDLVVFCISHFQLSLSFANKGIQKKKKESGPSCRMLDILKIISKFPSFLEPSRLFLFAFVFYNLFIFV